MLHLVLLVAPAHTALTDIRGHQGAVTEPSLPSLPSVSHGMDTGEVAPGHLLLLLLAVLAPQRCSHQPCAASLPFQRMGRASSQGRDSSQPGGGLGVVQGAVKSRDYSRLQISFPSAHPSYLTPELGSESAAAAKGGSAPRWEFTHPGWDQTASACPSANRESSRSSHLCRTLWEHP